MQPAETLFQRVYGADPLYWSAALSYELTAAAMGEKNRRMWHGKMLVILTRQVPRRRLLEVFAVPYSTSAGKRIPPASPQTTSGMVRELHWGMYDIHTTGNDALAAALATVRVLVNTEAYPVQADASDEVLTRQVLLTNQRKVHEMRCAHRTRGTPVWWRLSTTLPTWILRTASQSRADKRKAYEGLGGPLPALPHSDASVSSESGEADESSSV